MEELLREMEGYAALHHVPIINERGRQAFLQVVQEAKPHRVLEIGTAIGYSSLLMAQHGAADIEITTLELSDERIKTAQGYIDRSAYADRIHIMGGDAAAELAVFDYALFERSLAETRQKLRRLSDRKTDEMRKMQEYFRLKLLSHSPERELNTRRQALADISDRMELLMSGHIRESRRDLELSRERMERGIAAKLSDRQKRLQVLAGRLDGRSPLRKISGGFGFVTDKSDARIDTVDKAQKMLSQNCNMNLLVTWLCANIRQSRHVR